jgi:hypothetical protein
MLAHALNPNTITDVSDALATSAALGRTLHVEKIANAADVGAAVATLVGKQGGLQHCAVALYRRRSSRGGGVDMAGTSSTCCVRSVASRLLADTVKKVVSG